MAPFIRIAAKGGNTVKALEARLCIYPLCFQAVVRFCGTQIFVFFRAPAGPVNHHTVDFIAPAEAKSYWQFRLRKIAGARSDHPRLHQSFVENANRCTDRVPIRLRALQSKPNAPKTRCLIVAVQICWSIVGGHQEIQVTVTIEIAVG